MLNVKQDILKNNFLVRASVWLIINIYRRHIKPYRNNKVNVICGFYPDCSEYGILALRKYGFFMGWFKIINRISRCTSHRHDKSCIDFP